MIDLRSDTASRPSPEMRAAMAAADVGDEQLREDPTVNELQRRAAELLGHEAALFLPTATMANQIALRLLSRPGGLLVAEERTHVLIYEAGGPAVHSGLVMRGLPGTAGRLLPEQLRAIDDLVPGSVVVLENTHRSAGGRVWPLDAFEDTVAAARDLGMAVHLDGARLFNASVALGVPLRELAALVDMVAVSLNKGLCAPMGAILAGDAHVIELAHGTLRRLGGASVHKAGIAAAAALVALDTLVERLADDHRRARELAALLRQIAGLEVVPAEIETNIVLVDVSGTGHDPEQFLRLLGERRVLGLVRDTKRVRLVTHRGIGDADVSRAAEIVAELAAHARIP